MPPQRIRALNDAPVRRDGRWVVYWMVAQRRTRWSFAFDRAVSHARALGRPLVVLEPLRVGYRWASARLHRFVIDGMAEHASDLADRPVTYHPYVEPREGAGKGLLEAWANDACVIVTDDWPCFFVPRMQAAAADRLDVAVEVVDSCGLYPMRATQKVFSRAYDFRRHLQKALPEHLTSRPNASPLAQVELPKLDGIPEDIAQRWPPASEALLAGDAGALGALPIDHSVGVVDFRGGRQAAVARTKRFLDQSLASYGDGRNHPDEAGSSGLSPWLHFGHLSVHEVFWGVVAAEGWSPDRLAGPKGGAREGWWGMSASAEAFIDELVTWREVGLNMCAHREDYDQYESLPPWALQTIDEHADDPRPQLYSLEQLEGAETDDEVWNAAQREIVQTGRMHNYLRMLWGKKIYEWSPNAREALERMVHLNNKYGVDGRDPNSYSGIFWVLGRYDRAWGPERDVFGKLRYMTSDSTRKKLRLATYLQRFGPQTRLL